MLISKWYLKNKLRPKGYFGIIIISVSKIGITFSSFFNVTADSKCNANTKSMLQFKSNLHTHAIPIWTKISCFQEAKVCLCVYISIYIFIFIIWENNSYIIVHSLQSSWKVHCSKVACTRRYTSKRIIYK